MKATLGWILLSIALLVLAAIGIRAFLVNRAMSALGPAEKVYLHELQTKVLTFDPKDIDAQPFDPATLISVAKVHARYNMLSKADREFLRDIRITTEPLTVAAAERELGELSRFDDLTSAFAELVRQPDYEFSALAAVPVDPSSPPLGLPDPVLFEVLIIGKPLRRMSLAALESGHIREAMDLAETLVRAAYTHRFSKLIYHLFCVAIAEYGTISWFNAVDRCDDPDLLRRALDRQSMHLAKVATLTSGVPLVVLEALSVIRDGKRLGLPSQVYGGTGLQIVGERYRMEADYLERLVLPNLTNQEEVENTRRLIEDQRGQAASVSNGAQTIRLLAARLAAGSSDSEMVEPDSIVREILIRANTTKSRFDLLRLATAGKLYRLEKGGEPATIQDLVPAYLPEVPVDVFSPESRPYQLIPEPYSVGPDGADQKAAIAYDPTNGTISPGDIVLHAAGR